MDTWIHFFLLVYKFHDSNFKKYILIVELNDEQHNIFILLEIHTLTYVEFYYVTILTISKCINILFLTYLNILRIFVNV